MCEQKYCCCKCKHQITLSKHPWNELGKGSVLELFGYACIVESEMENNRKGTFSDNEHGECEMFTPIEITNG